MIQFTLSGDVFLKSRRTQARLVAKVLENLRAAVGDLDIERLDAHRFAVDEGGAEPRALAEGVARVFGVGGVDVVTELAAGDLDHLARAVTEAASRRVAGRTFAVRVKRRGDHPWRSRDLEVAAGTLLVAAGGRVDLERPEETVAVTVLDDRAFLVVDHLDGAAGLPLGSQGTVLALISGGFDSAVAAWMAMSRGAAVEFVHFTLTCSQSDHALAVAHTLWERWGAGMEPLAHVVDFQPIREVLVADVDPRMRQVVLKVLMARAAEQIARERRIGAAVTGDALGQVSSQTLRHLTAVSRSVDLPLLRPLFGMGKEEIIARARRIGTAEISERAREVCDLSDGGVVATGASRRAVGGATAAVPDELLEHAVTTRKTFRLDDWMPGAP